MPNREEGRKDRSNQGRESWNDRICEILQTKFRDPEAASSVTKWWQPWTCAQTWTRAAAKMGYMTKKPGCLMNPAVSNLFLTFFAAGGSDGGGGGGGGPAEQGE